MSSQHHNSSESMAIALIGNPGVGKSTILNGLVQSNVFKAGLATGAGLTTRLQSFKSGDVTFFDTPGLNDVKKRIQAGKEIDKLLQQNVSLRIAFVVTTRHGRVSPEDATTIGIVLDAIKSVDTDDKFGVIVNQMKKKEHALIKKDAIVERAFRSQVTGKRFTTHWYYQLHEPEIDEAEDAQLMTPELRAFIEGLPETKPEEADVANLNLATFEEVIQQERERFAEREKQLNEEMEKQKEACKNLEQTAAKLEDLLNQEKSDNLEKQREMDQKQAELEQALFKLAEEIKRAQVNAKSFEKRMKEEKERAQEQEEKGRAEWEDLKRQLDEVNKKGEEREAEMTGLKNKLFYANALNFVIPFVPMLRKLTRFL